MHASDTNNKILVAVHTHIKSLGQDCDCVKGLRMGVKQEKILSVLFLLVQATICLVVGTKEKYTRMNHNSLIYNRINSS